MEGWRPQALRCGPRSPLWWLAGGYGATEDGHLSHQLGRLLGLRREPLVHLELRLLGVLGGALLGRRRALGLADGLEQLSVLWRESGVDGVERLLRLRRALLRDLQEGRWEEM